MASPAQANHDPKCGTKGVLAPTARGIVPVEAGPAGRYYLDDRAFVGGNGLWLYKESTGNTTLQRRLGTGSSAPVVGKTLSDNGSTDTCTDDGVTATSPVDTLYF